MSSGMYVEAMLTPGANRSNAGPPRRSRTTPRPSFASLAPTQITFSAGIWQRLDVVSSSALSLPAARTYSVFGCRVDRGLDRHRERRLDARVDDRDAEIAGHVERRRERGVVPVAEGVQRDERKHLRGRGDARDAERVVLARGERAGHMRAVAVRVGDVRGLRQGVPDRAGRRWRRRRRRRRSLPDLAGVRPLPAGEVLVRGVHAAVDDRDDLSGAGRLRPRLRGVDVGVDSAFDRVRRDTDVLPHVLEPPELREEWVARRRPDDPVRLRVAHARLGLKRVDGFDEPAGAARARPRCRAAASRRRASRRPGPQVAPRRGAQAGVAGDDDVADALVLEALDLRARAAGRLRTGGRRARGRDREQADEDGDTSHSPRSITTRARRPKGRARRMPGEFNATRL